MRSPRMQGLPPITAGSWLIRGKAAGQGEVLDDNTLLLRLEPEEQQQSEAEEDTLRLGLFLDFLSRQARTVDQGPVLHTGSTEIEASLRTRAAVGHAS